MSVYTKSIQETNYVTVEIPLIKGIQYGTILNIHISVTTAVPPSRYSVH